MTISANDVIAKAAELNLSVTKTTKGSKTAWEFNHDGASMTIVGNKAAMEAMNFLAASIPASSTTYDADIKLKAGVLENPNATTEVMMLACADPNVSVEAALNKVKAAGKQIGKATVAVTLSDTKKVLAHLQRARRLLA